MTTLHNATAEAVLITTLMTIQDTFDGIATLVSADDFAYPPNRIIFAAINELAKTGQHDAVTVSIYLANQHALESIGGEAYLSRLLAETPCSLSNLPYHAAAVRGLRQRRDMESALNNSLSILRDNRNDETAEVMGRVLDVVGKAADSTTRNDLTVVDSASALVSMMSSVMSEDIGGAQTGFIELDNIITGLTGGDVYVIAARPAMGKSLLSMNIADHISTTTEKPALVFNMEMDSDALMMRLMACRARVNINSIKTGGWDSVEWSRLQPAMDEWTKNGRILFTCKGGLTPNDITSIAKRTHREKGGLSCIVVDYLQLMRIEGHGGNRENEVSEISRSLKALAMDLDVPVIALSQLNRGVESRPNKRPVLSDLRESGAIEQDASVVIFIYRDEVYNPTTQAKGLAELIVGKQRQGPLGTAVVNFRGEFGCFENHIGNYEGMTDE